MRIIYGTACVWKIALFNQGAGAKQKKEAAEKNGFKFPEFKNY